MRPRIIFMLSLALPALADEAPSWLRELATASVPAYEKNVAAAVLLNETSVAVEDSGRMVTTTRSAIRILTREGRARAVAEVFYRTDGGKVKNLDAWMVSPSGAVKKFGKNETTDLAFVNEDIYNELRMRVIDASDRADPGATFGFEGQTEERSVFTQFDWPFQDKLPVKLARFELTLPPAWRAESITFNHAPVQPQISGSTSAWQLRDLAPIETEEAAPEISSLAPRLAVSFFPPAGAKTPARSFSSWTDVSKWLSELNDSQAVPSAALEAKAKELVSNKSTEFERIEAIGRYVQGVRYVSIQMGASRGGGLKPHPAAEVFAKGYGDCKDKANLMRAMLRSVGVEAWPVAIYSSDRMYVHAEWPSPEPFDHAIIAIRVSDQVQGRAVAAYAPLGRLLFFDPTDEYPLGWLPEPELGSQALIIAGENGGLVRMPLPDPAGRRIERHSQVALSADGGITVRVHERNLGSAAVMNRSILSRTGMPEYQKWMERRIASTATSATISKLEPKEPGPAEFTLDFGFSAPHYAQLMQGRLLVFKPALLAHDGWPNLNDTSRKTPIVLEARSFTDSIEVQVPEGFIVDELPPSVRAETSFASWEASVSVTEEKLIFTRKLQLETSIIPAEEYRQVRDFFNRVAESEQEPVVLIRR